MKHWVLMILLELVADPVGRILLVIDFVCLCAAAYSTYVLLRDWR